MAIKSSFFLACFFLIALNSFGQTEEEPKDTVIPKLWHLSTTEQLADTVWWALKQKTNTEFMSLIPTISIIKETFDTLEIKENAQLIKIKYNLIHYTVGKQLKHFKKRLKAIKLTLRTVCLNLQKY